jgi:hypothetical protein
MATNARTQGANARQIDWDEAERQTPQRTGTWLPLDALDDDDPIYAGTPQLRSMPAPSRQIAMPQRSRAQEIAPTRPQQQARPAAAPRQRESANPLGTVVSARTVAMLAGIAIAALATYVLLSAAIDWAQVKMDDLQYGRPRTVQMDAYVGQNEAEGVPSHFIAMNLNRRVTIVEIPGGFTCKVKTLKGP